MASIDADGWLKWLGGPCPVKPDAYVDFKDCHGKMHEQVLASNVDWSGDIAKNEHAAVYFRMWKPMPVTMSEPTSTAPAILQRAAQHLLDRAAAYDAPGGERSMARTVAVFNALHGTTLSEAQGWSFMAVLKQVRAFQSGGLHIDSIEDGAAYLALLGEAQGRAEGGV